MRTPILFFILIGFIGNAYAIDHCEFVFGCRLDYDPRTDFVGYSQEFLLELGKERAEYYKEEIITVWITKYDYEIKDYTWIIAKLTLVPSREAMPHACYPATGCYIHGVNEIYIIKHWEDNPSKFGCSVLWHEILHGQGLDHWEMKTNPRYANWECAVGNR